MPLFRVARPLAAVLALGLAPATHAAFAFLYEVTTTADDGDGSLRDALFHAENDHADSDIKFNIPGPGPHTIQPLSPLGFISQPVFIDGSDQLGPNGEPYVELSGASAGISGIGLSLGGAGSTVRSLTINGWQGSGVTISGPGSCAVENCQIGTDVTGMEPRPNSTGININDSPNNRIGGPGHGNVVSGNGLHGISIFGASASGNVIQSNFIGPQRGALERMNSGQDGIEIFAMAHDNTVGGIASTEGNVVSGNSSTGIFIDSGPNNVIEGNLVGPGVDGVTRIGNGNVGVWINGTENRVGDGTPERRNVVGGSNGTGIRLGGFGNRVWGNYIGTDATGDRAMRNSGEGVLVFGVQGCQVGGSIAGRGNVISGNFGNGVELYGSDCQSNFIRGNFIGTNADGTAAVPNSRGIVTRDAQFNFIGGTDTVDRNLISGNLSDGIDIEFLFGGGFATHNEVSGNWIGVDATGTHALANFGDGIHVVTPGNTIGGASAIFGNVISGNSGNGVFLNGSGNTVAFNVIGPAIPNTFSRIGTHPLPLGNGGDGIRLFTLFANRLSSNFIYANHGIGIDLNGDGPSANDQLMDMDGIQNYPILDSVTLNSGSSHHMIGHFHSMPNMVFDVQTFVSESGDPTHFGEGEAPLFAFQVQTDTEGNVGWSMDFDALLPPGRYVTATAINPDGTTSEFSPWVIATGPAPRADEIADVILGLIPDPGDLDLDGSGVIDAADLVRSIPAFSSGH
jgi:hypothetical protein